MEDLLESPKICGIRSMPSCKLKCACKFVFYCGAERQGKDWPRHKKKCVKSHTREIKEAREEHGKDHAAVGLAALDERNNHRRQGRCLEAERCFVDALRLCAEVGGEECEGIGDTSLFLGEMYCKIIGRYAEALPELHKGLQIYFSIKGERSQDAGRALMCIGDTLREIGKQSRRLRDSVEEEEEHSVLRETVGDDHFRVAGVQTYMGDVFFETGRLDEARSGCPSGCPQDPPHGTRRQQRGGGRFTQRSWR